MLTLALVGYAGWRTLTALVDSGPRATWRLWLDMLREGAK